MFVLINADPELSGLNAEALGLFDDETAAWQAASDRENAEAGNEPEQIATPEEVGVLENLGYAVLTLSPSQALWCAVDVNNGQVFGPFTSEEAAVAAIQDADFTYDQYAVAFGPDRPSRELLENDGWLFTPLMGVDKAEL